MPGINTLNRFKPSLTDSEWQTMGDIGLYDQYNKKSTQKMLGFRATAEAF